MKNAIQLFQEIIKKLDTQSIPYMIVGSVASIVYGEIRMTKDMDIVVNIKPEDSLKFENLFTSPEYYCPPREILIDECTNRGQFNLLHVPTGLKIDFIVCKNNPHSAEEFKRKRKITVLDMFEAYVAAPEDVILKKLQYFAEGQSQKHLSDIRGMLAQSEIDKKYLNKWIETLHLKEVWALV